MSKIFNSLKTPKEDKHRHKRERVSSPESDSGEVIQPEMDLTAILGDINSKLEKLNTIDNRVHNIETTVNDLKKSVEFALQTADEAKSMATANQSKCTKLEKCVCDLQNENQHLYSKIDYMNEHMIRLESQSRRNNLNIDGVNEKPNEKPDDILGIVRDILAKAKIPNSDSIPIERSHRRPGMKGKPKPIIVKFLSFTDRELVWRHREAISSQGIWVRQDFPKAIEERRAKFRPILKAAKLDPRYNKKGQVSLSVDRLIVDGKPYRHDQLNALPDGLKPHQISTRVVNDMTLFFQKESPFSSFHPAEFEVNHQKYSCAEQYYQVRKAEHFKDDLSAQKIMSTNDPYEHYSCGRKKISMRHNGYPVQQPNTWRKLSWLSSAKMVI